MSEYLPEGKDIILMIFMFRGNYLDKQLGHEIINTFKDDDGNHYIYVSPWGHVNNKYSKKIGTILLVRHVSNWRVEIVAKAWGLSEPFPGVAEIHLKNSKEMRENQIKKCKGIKYGKKSIVDIFDLKKLDNDQEILVSYQAKNYRRTKKSLYISYFKTDSDKKSSFDSNFYSNDIKMPGNMPKQTLRAYYLPSSDNKNVDQTGDYEKLKGIIEDESLWGEDDSKKIELEDAKFKNNDDYFSILKAIGREDDELVFSNWFKYYFDHHDLMDKFAREVLELTDGIGREHEVLRESKHIDLLIKDVEHKRCIVIENKIKSGINGQKSNGTTQLDDYCTQAQKIAKNKNWNVDNNQFFIFTPDYNNISTSEKINGKWTVIKYSQIYKFFHDSKDEYKKYLFIEHFIRALARHKSEYPDEIFEDMRRKFIDTIREREE